MPASVPPFLLPRRRAAAISPESKTLFVLGALRNPVDYFSEDSLRQGLKQKAVRGGAVTAVAQVASLMVSLAAVPALARLLDPADFGLVAMVAVFTNFARMFVDAGLSMATVQRPTITPQQVSNLFWIASGMGALIAVIVVCLAPAIAWFYGEPRLTAITLALAISFVLSGLTVQHQALLRRGMQFGALSTITVISMLLGQVAAIAWAYYYFGTKNDYWALVLIPIVTTGVQAVATWMACGWRPRWPVAGAGTRDLVVYGADLTGFNFVNYFARNADNLLIGWFFGPVLLGFYERAYKLLMAPLQQINGPISGVAIPTLSRVVNQRQAYRKAYFRISNLLQLVACPAIVWIAILSPQIVDVALGPGWSKAAPILRWLCIAGLFQPLTNSYGWLYISQGRSRDLLRWGFIGCPLIALSFVAGLPWGPVGVACAYALVVNIVVVPLACYFAGNRELVSARDLAWQLFRSFIFMAPVTATTFATLALIGHWNSFALTLTSAAVCLVTMAAVAIGTSSGRRLASELITNIVSDTKSKSVV